MEVGAKSCRRATPVGCSPARGAKIASKSAVSSSGIMVTSPAGLVGYDTRHAAMLKGQTFRERAFRHVREHLSCLCCYRNERRTLRSIGYSSGLTSRGCGAAPWTAPPVRSTLLVGG